MGVELALMPGVELGMLLRNACVLGNGVIPELAAIINANSGWGPRVLVGLGLLGAVEAVVE